MANKDAIAALLAVQETVEVHGQKIVLSIPSSDVLSEVRTVGAKMAASDGQISEEAMQQMAQLGVNVMAACAGCTHDEASRLIAVSGGENGDLMQAAFRLSGLDAKAADDAEELDRDF